MNEFQLKYGCNPNQKPSRIFMADGSELPVEILNGRPGYINFLDAFNGWQLVKELMGRLILVTQLFSKVWRNPGKRGLVSIIRNKISR